MAKEFQRTERVAQVIQRELAQLIRSEVKDPRLGMVSISAVRVAKDLAHARVFVSTLNSDDEASIKQDIEILNGAAGFLRHNLGKSVNWRHTPALKFEYDVSIQEGAKIERILSQVTPPQEESEE